MKLLNLGCGTKVSHDPRVINIDWSIYLRIKKSRLLRTIAPLFLNGYRLENFNNLSHNIMVYDLSKKVPFESDSIDAVYHSHMLEHLDREVARLFLKEVRKVLKPGGIQRIVVPDFEQVCKEYISHLTDCENAPREAERHNDFIARIIEQSVRKESSGTSRQKPLRRYIENLILGDARKRGETHQWTYDRISLAQLLKELQYKNVTVQAYNTSSIPDWNEIGLDLDEFGNEYKPGSLYMEAEK